MSEAVISSAAGGGGDVHLYVCAFKRSGVAGPVFDDQVAELAADVAALIVLGGA